MAKLKIISAKASLIFNLLDTATSQKIVKALPFESTANTWGEEVYFETPVEAKLEPDARQVVEPGTLCFWVEGSSLAIPYGRTPVSQGDECRLVARVNILGAIEGNPKTLGSIRSGDKLRVEALA